MELGKFVFKAIFANSAMAAATGATIWIMTKKRFPTAGIVFLLSLLPIYSLFWKGTFESGDVTISAIKLMSFYKNLSEGQFIPRWAGELNATYGYPMHMFNYMLPYFFASALHWMGIGFIDSIKAEYGIAYVVSNLAFYGYAKRKFAPLPAILATACFAFAPYHLIDLHYRGTPGETTAFVWLPICLWLAELWMEKKQIKYGMGMAAAVAALILSHQAIALFFIPILAMYTWVFGERSYKKN